MAGIARHIRRRILGDLDIDFLLVSRLHPDQRIFQFFLVPRLADHDCFILTAAVRNRLARFETFYVEHHVVARFRGAVHVFKR